MHPDSAQLIMCEFEAQGHLITTQANDAMSVNTTMSGILQKARELGQKWNPKQWISRLFKILPSVIIFVSMVAGKYYLEEKTEPGRDFERSQYKLVLTSFHDDAEIPIVIVDSSAADHIASRKGYKYHDKVTDRKQLKMLAVAIANECPIAIGFDKDFSPDSAGYSTDQDEDFLRECLDIKSGKADDVHCKQADDVDRNVPVYVGIYFTIGNDPIRWLSPGNLNDGRGGENFSPLARSLALPDASENQGEVRRMILWTHADGTRQAGSSLSQALAEEYVSAKKVNNFHPLYGFDWAFALVTKNKAYAGIPDGEFLIDYSPLDALKDGKITPRTLKDGTVPAISDMGWKLKDKIVIIGDVADEQPGDRHNIPGRDGVLGAYIQACAVYTLVHHPLYEVTFAGRIFLDVLFPLLVLTIVGIFSRHLAKKHAGSQIRVERIKKDVTWLIAITAFIVWILLVRLLHVMWDDIWPVLGALAVHTSLEKYLETAGPEWANQMSASWKAIEKDRYARVAEGKE